MTDKRKHAGELARDTIYMTYGEDYYSHIGEKGGKSDKKIKFDKRKAVTFDDYTLFNDGTLLFNGQMVMPFKDNKDGKLYVSILDGGVKKSKPLDELVAKYFVKNHFNKPLVVHLNGKIRDNRALNLCWMTEKEAKYYPVKKVTHTELYLKRMSEIGGELNKAVSMGCDISELAKDNKLSEKIIRDMVYDFKPKYISTVKVKPPKYYLYYDSTNRVYRIDYIETKERKVFKYKQDVRKHLRLKRAGAGFASKKVEKDGLTGWERAIIVSRKGVEARKKNRLGRKNNI